MATSIKLYSYNNNSNALAWLTSNICKEWGTVVIVENLGGMIDAECWEYEFENDMLATEFMLRFGHDSD